ncbi:MAG: ProQ/FinO family protein [Candidatus Tectomicrobia bacterium]
MGSKRSSEARRRRRQRVLPQLEKVYEELFEKFPNTFFRDLAEIRPLKKGIYHDIRGTLPVSSRILHGAIGLYTQRQPYLRALADGKDRIDLSGKSVEPVTEEERQHALALLKTKRRGQEKSNAADKAGE